MGSSLKITKWLIQKLLKCRKSKIIDFVEGNLCNVEKEYDVNSASFVAVMFPRKTLLLLVQELTIFWNLW